jgi:hypothetical protein
MKISEVIEKLNKIKEEHGDISVEVRDIDAVFYTAEAVETTFHYTKDGIRYVVFFDV